MQNEGDVELVHHLHRFTQLRTSPRGLQRPLGEFPLFPAVNLRSQTGIVLSFRLHVLANFRRNVPEVDANM